VTTVRARGHRFRSRVCEAAARSGRAAALGTAVSLSVGGVRRAGAHLLETAVDVRMGVSTRGLVENGPVLRASACGDGHPYQAVPVRKFRRILAAAPVVPADSTFLDLGAGRGRALLLAAEAGFRDVVGVELDPALAADAERNLTRYARGRGVAGSVRCQDAADVVVPDGPLLVFVYNSFGPRTLRRVLDRLEDSSCTDPRPLLLAYHNPVHADVVEERPALVPTGRGRDWALYSVARPGPGSRTAEDA
jgi:SAM-dependent methyltransferase